ncbi:RING-H2 finger protein ATL18 [Macadamia integrifolia]|uniref:RING-H2 finger protein ATL18 n=1 Tax=Macadamia integrifolia TaxID=60698 RepID=UPI001C4F5886|nr:RING-H2 finger protein ATL18 [Macadamia integrifolia]
MICLGLSPSGLNVAAIIIYTCILIPVRQLKESLKSLFGLLPTSCTNPPITLQEPFYVDLNCLELDDMNHLDYHHQTDDLPLPMMRFRELAEVEEGDEEESCSEVCSVCLVEFQKEDQVTKLSRCGHVFHLCCIKSWVDRNRFTCPLCRSFLLNVSL